jgi:hypothetical protein
VRVEHGLINENVAPKVSVPCSGVVSVVWLSCSCKTVKRSRKIQRRGRGQFISCAGG